jgi:hypothetical protein
MGSYAPRDTCAKGSEYTLFSKAIGAARSGLEKYFTHVGQETHDPRAMSPLSHGDEGLGGRIDLSLVLVRRWLDGAGPQCGFTGSSIGTECEPETTPVCEPACHCLQAATDRYPSWLGSEATGVGRVWRAHAATRGCMRPPSQNVDGNQSCEIGPHSSNRSILPRVGLVDGF